MKAYIPIQFDNSFRCWKVVREYKGELEELEGLLNWEQKLLILENYEEHFPKGSKLHFFMADPGNPEKRLFIQAEVLHCKVRQFENPQKPLSNMPENKEPNTYTLHMRIWHRVPRAEEGWIL
jgi:hypothetical protein